MTGAARTVSLENLYQKLSVALQNAACSYQGRRIRRRRYNGAFHSALNEFLSRRSLSPESMLILRNQRLRSFVIHSALSVPYYLDTFASRRIDPEEIQSLADLVRLPIMTKSEAQANLVALRSTVVSGHETFMTHTSGTTGSGLVFPLTHSAEREQWALWWRYRIELGIEFDTPCGVFSGRAIVPVKQTRAPFWRYNKPAKQVLFSGYHLKEENLSRYVSEIKRSGVRWLHGYPSHLTLLASHLLNSSDDLRKQITHVTSGAESLLAHQRELIERAFDSRMYQHYGLAEGVANISECAHGTLHVDEDFSAVEFIREDGADNYRIIGTNFTNDAFPLLRYDTGDVASGLSENTDCPCGVRSRTVKSIDGRVEDYIVLADGTKVGRIDHIFKDMTAIREAQIIQRTPGRIVLRIVRAREYRERDEKKLRAETEKYLGKNTHSDIQYVESLQRGKTGKLRFVISEIPEACVSFVSPNAPGAAPVQR